MTRRKSYDVYRDHIRVYLTQGYVAYLDLEDIHLVNAGQKWRVFHPHEAGRRDVACRDDRYLGPVTLHQMVMRLPAGSRHIRAIDGNFLNCRRSNLILLSATSRLRETVPTVDLNESAHAVRRNSKTGITNVTIRYCSRSHKPYYQASVMRNGQTLQETFPYTPEGFEAAKAAAQWMRDVLTKGGPSHSSV